MLLDELLSRRLLILSGKGGVGKSTVGLALSLAARERGKHVLLVEVDAPLEAARVLGAGPAGQRETEALPGLFTLNLDPARAMDEYVRHVLVEHRGRLVGIVSARDIMGAYAAAEPAG